MNGSKAQVSFPIETLAMAEATNRHTPDWRRCQADHQVQYAHEGKLNWIDAKRNSRFEKDRHQDHQGCDGFHKHSDKDQ